MLSPAFADGTVGRNTSRFIFAEIDLTPYKSCPTYFHHFVWRTVVAVSEDAKGYYTSISQTHAWVPSSLHDGLAGFLIARCHLPPTSTASQQQPSFARRTTTMPMPEEVSYYTYCFDFFAVQNLALFLNLASDLTGDYPYLPYNKERWVLIFLWIFDLVGYHAAEMETLPSSWPQWVAPVMLIIGSLCFYIFGIVLISKLPANSRLVPSVLLAISALIYFVNEWMGKTPTETSHLHGKGKGKSTYTHLSYFVFQMSIFYYSSKPRLAKEKTKTS